LKNRKLGKWQPWAAGAAVLLLLFTIGAEILSRFLRARQFDRIVGESQTIMDERAEFIASRYRDLVSDAYVAAKTNARSLVVSASGELKANHPASVNLNALAISRGDFDWIAMTSPDGEQIMRLRATTTSDGRTIVENEFSDEKPLATLGGEPWFRSLQSAGENEVVFLPILRAIDEHTGRSGWLLRFGAPLMRRDQRIGLIVFSHRIGPVFESFVTSRLTSESPTLVVREDGTVLRDSDAEAGSAAEELLAAGASVARTFPDEWKRMSRESRGAFQTANGLFAFRSLEPGGAALEPGGAPVRAVAASDGGSLKLLTRWSPAVLGQRMEDTTRPVWMVWSISLGVLVPLAGTVAVLGHAKMRAALDRERSAAELSLNRQRLLDAHKIARAGCWEWSPETGETWCSETIEEIGGRLTRGEERIAGLPAHVFPADDRLQLMRGLESLRDRSESLHVEQRIVDPDAGVRWVHIEAHAEPSDDGLPRRVLGVTQDVTARVENERRIRETGDLLNGILNSTMDGIVAVESVRDTKGEIADFRFVVANSATERLTGRTHGELIGRRLREVFPGDFDDGLFEKCRDVVESGEPIAFEHHFGPGAVDRWFRIGGVRLEDGLVISFTDISESKRSEQLLKESRNHAEAANRAKSQFLAMMSHEIRTPMNGVLGFADLLADSTLDPDQQDHVATIQTSGSALVRIIDDILDYSRIETGRLELRPTRFSPRELVAGVAELLRVRAEAKHLAVRTEIADDVPDWVAGDDGRLRQVLLNLVGNAVKFTAGGSVTVELATSSRDDERIELSCRVSDTGPGIPIEEQARLFEPFSQADPGLARQHGGAGLGLAISKRLVNLMGGRIDLVSSPGNGTAFHFTVWVAIAGENLPARGAAVHHPEDKNFAQRHPLRLLVVDDDPSNRKLLRRLLESLGYTPEVATSGFQALECFERSTFDAILMDLQMPGLDGLEATRRARSIEGATGGHTFIAAVTANALNDIESECLRAGMDACLTKPIKREVVAELLKRASSSQSSPA